MDLRMDTCVVPAEDAELVRYPDDEIWLRAVGRGDVQVVEYFSTDRPGPPAHSHPWHEVEVVLDGAVEFLVEGTWTEASAGAVQLLPAGAPHSVRVPSGRARLLMVTIAAPYDAFARDVARCIDTGAPLVELAAVAGRHGVRLA